MAADEAHNFKNSSCDLRRDFRLLRMRLIQHLAEPGQHATRRLLNRVHRPAATTPPAPRSRISQQGSKTSPETLPFQSSLHNSEPRWRIAADPLAPVHEVWSPL